MSDFIDSAVSILEQVAPTIATMIGGPFAGMGVSAIEKALGLNPTGDKNAALQAVANATPEQLLALKQEDNRHAEALKKLDLDSDALGAQDRDSARKMQMETKDWTPRAIAICTFIGFFGVLAGILSGKIASGTAGSEAFLLLLGTLATLLTQICAYYFGSSAGSAKKDDTLKAALAR